MKAKKLIEVAMPIKEISAESVRDKSLRHGHISTLQFWLARRPLPVCRAVVFASLVPDPIDDNCPQTFRDAVADILCTGIAKAMYSPYPDIPYTAIYDPMEDNLRNRLLMFIGKFSDKCQKEMIAGKKTTPKDQLQEGCLIKWESKNDETVLNRARKLIYVAYNAEQRPKASYADLSEEFDAAWENIKMAEERLYSIPDRHIENPDPNAEVNVAQRSLDAAIETFQSMMPSIFDPFAGGGAIPLEAARLGCRSYGNDINPVAHIIEKGSVEFPQKYGKPITYTRDEFMRLYGNDGIKLLQERELEFVNDEVTIPNRLSFDVEYYSYLLLYRAFEDVKCYYPQNTDGIRPVGYYWVRTCTCNNPSCSKEIPLLKSFSLSTKKGNEHSLYPYFEDGVLKFEIKKGKNTNTAYYSRANVTCPYCNSVIDAESLKTQSRQNGLPPILIALIYDSEGGKRFVLPDEENISILSKIPQTIELPTEKMHPNSGGGDTFGWGIDHYSQLFSPRQILTITALINSLNSLKEDLSYDYEYKRVLIIYLSMLINRITPRSNMFVLLNTVGEKLEHIYRNQAIAMVVDYPESGVFCKSIGGAYNQIDWITKYIESESSNPFSGYCCKCASGDITQFEIKSLDSVITDPPYYDAMAYADFSDFFYLWYKRMLYDVLPDIVSTPQTPKAEECTAIKHYHNNSIEEAKAHFENMLLKIFSTIERQTKGIISIMFAHQSTEAWTTLCNSILGADMNIKGSWAIDSERSSAGLKTDKAFLASSVTVACTPSERKGYASYKKVKDAIHKTVEEEVRSLYELGFRGADLLTACFGKAVSVFGNYESVEKADGSEVTVAELLEMARTAAFTALVKDFASDEYTKFYIGWLHLNGMGYTKHDDVVKFVRSGTALDISDVYHQNLLIKDEATNTQHLASYQERTKEHQMIPQEGAPLIDKVHAAMRFWADQNLTSLNALIARDGQDKNNEFWRVLFVLKELLPDGKDREQVAQLLGNADTRIEKAKTSANEVPKQASLFDDTDL